MKLTISALLGSLKGGSPVASGSEGMVMYLLIQLVVILAATRVVVVIVHRMGQTDVAGEILAGLLLGPSLLGAVAPGVSRAIFVPSTGPILTGLAQLGLVLLLFEVGLQFEFHKNLASGRKTILLVSSLGIGFPFTLGYFTAPVFYHLWSVSTRPDLLPFRLFFGLSLSITAIPILGRIFMELGLSHTRVGTLTIGAASLDDLLGWLLLGCISLLVVHEFSVAWLVWHTVAIATYLGAVFFGVRRFGGQLLRRRFENQRGLSRGTVAVVLMAVFASAAISSRLDVYAIIGGFVMGLALHENRAFVMAWRVHISPLVNGLLLPIFFVITGLRTNIGSITSWRQVGVLVLLIVIAFAGKLGGAFLGARLGGETARDSLAIAVCMNTRALMELIVLNIGLEIGVLPPSLFTMLVIMAVVSTFIATPVIRRLLHDRRLPVYDTYLPSQDAATPALALGS